MIQLIAIVDQNFGISSKGMVPWSFTEDMRFFRHRTIGGVIVMGKNTFLTIENMPLKNRINCVVSKTLKSVGNQEGVEVFSSLEDVIEKYAKHRDIWIIGGAALYNHCLEEKIVEKALITQVHQDFAADKYINSSCLSCMHRCVLFESERYSIYEYSA